MCELHYEISKKLMTFKYSDILLIIRNPKKIWKIFCDKLLSVQNRRQMNKNAQNLSNIQKQLMQNIVDEIKISSLQQVLPLGEIIKNKILTPNGYALYIDKKHDRIVLLRYYNHKQYPIDEGVIIRVIFGILTLIRSLVDDNSVYTIFPTYECDPFLYGRANDCQRVADNKFKINANEYLLLEEGKWSIKSGTQKLYDECFSFEEEICERLKQNLSLIVYPTERLEKFVQHDYQTQQDYNTRRSHNIARSANWMAFTIGILSLAFAPFINTYINNQKGYSTLKTNQFDSIINSQKSIQIVRDTIFIHRPDTINCVIIKDNTKKKIQKEGN